MDEIATNTSEEGGGKKSQSVALIVLLVVVVVVSLFVIVSLRQRAESPVAIPTPPGTPNSPTESLDDSPRNTQNVESSADESGVLQVSGSASEDGLSSSEAQTALEDIQTKIDAGDITEDEAEAKKTEIYEQLPPPPLPPMP